MSRRDRPHAPWYAGATRRLILLRFGLPTLLACVMAIGPGPAVTAQSVVVKNVAGLAVQSTAAASSVLGGHSHGHGDEDGAADGHADGH